MLPESGTGRSENREAAGLSISITVFGGISKGRVRRILECCDEADFLISSVLTVDAVYAVAVSDDGLSHLYIRFCGKRGACEWSRSPSMFGKGLAKKAATMAARWLSDVEYRPRNLTYRLAQDREICAPAAS